MSPPFYSLQLFWQFIKSKLPCNFAKICSDLGVVTDFLFALHFTRLKQRQIYAVCMFLFTGKKLMNRKQILNGWNTFLTAKLKLKRKTLVTFSVVTFRTESGVTITVGYQLWNCLQGFS